METLRNARTLAQVVFTWFVLTVCAATLAPLMHRAQPVQASQQLHGGHEGHHAEHDHLAGHADHAQGSVSPESLPSPHSAAHGLKCPLCLLSVPPPWVAPGSFTFAAPTHRVAPLVTHVEPRRLAAAPLPARGPPLTS